MGPLYHWPLGVYILASCALLVPAYSEPTVVPLEVQRDMSGLDETSPVVVSYADVVERVRSSVVTIEVKMAKSSPLKPANGSDEQQDFDLGALPKPVHDEAAEEDHADSGGTGIILTAEGLIVTNHHVVSNAAQIGVRLRGEDKVSKATVVGRDPATDVALLRLDEKRPLPAAVFGDSTKVRPGDVVLAMGTPFGLEQTVTLGVVSATGRDRVGLINDGLEDFIQTDAAINPGNSGGPLIDAKGRVIGMNTGRYWGENIGFSVPVNIVLKVAADLLRFGVVVRGQLGAHCVEMTPDLARSMGLPRRTRGAVVAEVQADGPAAKALLQPGDVIIRLDKLRVDGRARLFMALASTKPGDKAVLTILRGDKTKTLEARLDAPAGMLTFESQELWQMTPGLKLADLTQRMRDRFLIPNDISGLVVMETYRVPGNTAVLSPGDVVRTINGKMVDQLSDGQAAADASLEDSLMLGITRKGQGLFVSVPKSASK